MGIIEKIQKLCFKFIWFSKNNSYGLPWTSCKILANSKSSGGWGLKVPNVFSKALVAKNVWNIIQGSGLWVKIAYQKYIQPLNILEWIRAPVKKKEHINLLEGCSKGL